ncbi:nuclear transport factor 2 family protein [Christiangramia aquimixticola]|uniref:nuclear transport factor 2 family protein n=1 Tax=Christiangramia aquimixticola TaxID=1697558 RepID=UPI003AA930A8
MDRNKLIKKLNNAFAECDTRFLADSVTDDIQWKIVGEKTIAGKEQFERSLEKMRLGGPMNITIQDVLHTDKRSVVEGTVEYKTEPGRKKRYAFCDVYIFSDSDESKFRELRTYVSKVNKVD